MSDSDLQIPELWNKTIAQAKDRVISIPFWQALECTRAIALEGDSLIIGLPSQHYNLAGHITIAEHRNALESVLRALLGRPIRIRLIEGDSLADWTLTKQREQRVAAHREATYERKDQEAALAQSWDAIYEYAARAYSATPLRQLPQNKARYVTDMLYALSDAMDNLYPDNPDETTERLLARVIDRIATNSDMPASLVAFELARLRAWRAQQS
jgi:hypothetical protein